MKISPKIPIIYKKFFWEYYEIFLRILRRNHKYVNSPRMVKNRQIPNIYNILGHSRINWWVIAKTADFHIRYSPIFVFSENLEVPRIYSAHDDEYREYTNTLIRILLVHLFSRNILGYSPRINVCVVPSLGKFSENITKFFREHYEILAEL